MINMINQYKPSAIWAYDWVPAPVGDETPTFFFCDAFAEVSDEFVAVFLKCRGDDFPI